MPITEGGFPLAGLMPNLNITTKVIPPHHRQKGAATLLNKR
jgi:hypothetical protein